MRISDYVSHWAERTPLAEALVLGSERITFAALASRVDALSRALMSAGVGPGDRVATLCTPHPDYFVCFLATVSIGAIWVGLNPRHQRTELEYVCADATPTVVLARTHIGQRCYLQDLEAVRTSVPSIRYLVALDREDAPGFLPYSAFLALATHTDAPVASNHMSRSGREACLLVYTSGSTGQPKGALLHHEGIVEFSRAQNRAWPVSRHRMLNYFPINHIGCVIDVSCPILVAGGCIVFMEQFDPREALQLMAREQITVWASVPSAFQLQLALPDFGEHDLSRVELILWEGAAMAEDSIRRLLTICPRLATNYGMTETTSAMTIVTPTDDIEVLAQSVGYPFEGVELRLVDGEGQVVSRGTPGEVQARSLYNMLGYWNRPHETEQVMKAGGWFATGDLAVERPDGRYRIVGRLKEMYKSGGYNVYPRELEHTLEAHPAVALAAVVAIPDPLWQEVGVAYVIPNGVITSDELLAYCRQRLANYKIPKRFVMCEKLPLLPIGKVDKVTLRRLAQEADLAAKT